MRKGVLLVLRTGSPVIFILMLPPASHLANRTGSPVFRLGNKSGTHNKARKDVARPQPTSRNRLRVQNRVNDNYCINCVTRQEDFVYVSGKVDRLNPPPVLSAEKDLSITSKRKTVNLHVNSCVVSPVHFAKGYPQKKGVNPINCQNCTEIIYMKDVSCVVHLSSVNLVTNVLTVAPDLPVGARLHQFYEKW